MVGRVCTSRGREPVAAQVAQAEQLQLLLCIARGLAGSDVAGAGEHRDHLGAKAGVGGEYAVEPGEVEVRRGHQGAEPGESVLEQATS